MKRSISANENDLPPKKSKLLMCAKSRKSGKENKHSRSEIENEIPAKKSRSKSPIFSTLKKRSNELEIAIQPPKKIARVEKPKKENRNDKIEGLKYKKACGIKKDSQCIYIPTQQLMYVKNSTNKHGQITYICYNYKSQRCTARVVAINDFICKPTEKSGPHTCVGNRKQFRRDCKLLKNIKEKAISVNKITGTQSCAVSLRALIDEEKSK